MPLNIDKVNEYLDSIILEDLMARHNGDLSSILANEALGELDLNSLVSYKWNPESQTYRETNEHVNFAVPQKAMEVAKGDLDTLKEWVMTFIADSIADIDKTKSGVYDYEESGTFSRFIRRKPKLHNYPMPEIEVYDSPTRQYNITITNIDDALKIDLKRFIDYYAVGRPNWENFSNTLPASVDWYMFLWGMFKKDQVFTAKEDIPCIGEEILKGDELTFLNIKNWSEKFSIDPFSSRAIAIFRSSRGIHGIPYGHTMNSYLVVMPTANKGIKYPKRDLYEPIQFSRLSTKRTRAIVSAKIQNRWKTILASARHNVKNYTDDYTIIEEKNWWDSLVLFDRNHDFGYRHKADLKYEASSAAARKERQDEIDEQTALYNAGKDNYLRVLQHGRSLRDTPRNGVIERAEEILWKSIHGYKISKEERNRAKADLEREKKRLDNMKWSARSLKKRVKEMEAKQELERLIREFEERFPY